MPGGPARRWGAALVAAYGTGLIVAGVLVADPSMGWPAGAPEGPPATMSWHGIGHGVGAMLAFGSVTLACLVFARHHARSGRRAWAVFSLACALTFALMLAWPDQDSISVRMALGSTVVFAWLTAVCVDLLPSR
ncbi:DUF998 domain-containing protein [Micromonospora sp. NPDC049799]|uniref:DUF998 domain-containing protein n=1 Tax=Micromonospora sp. NPDC049799 TaxID=3154741 RepID=UPI0033D742BB